MLTIAIFILFLISYTKRLENVRTHSQWGNMPHNFGLSKYYYLTQRGLEDTKHSEKYNDRSPLCVCVAAESVQSFQREEKPKTLLDNRLKVHCEWAVSTTKGKRKRKRRRSRRRNRKIERWQWNDEKVHYDLLQFAFYDGIRRRRRQKAQKYFLNSIVCLFRRVYHFFFKSYVHDKIYIKINKQTISIHVVFRIVRRNLLE